jgi:hypothetical protein
MLQASIVIGFVGGLLRLPPLRGKIRGSTKEIAIFPEGGIVPPLARVLFSPLPIIHERS